MSSLPDARSRASSASSARTRSVAASTLAASTPALSLGVPAYFGPWQRSDWSALLQAAPQVVVVNPASGPGVKKHPGYVRLIKTLQHRGTTVLGYVPTTWLSRPTEDVLADADRYLDSTRGYGAAGILFDEIPVEPQTLRVIKQLIGTLRDGRPDMPIACNPGRSIPTSWFALANVWWITFEGTASQYLDRFGAASNEACTSAQASKTWHLVHSVGPRTRARVEQLLASNAPGLYYLTPDRLPNPWDVFAADPPSGSSSGVTKRN